jgi:proline iminopeptidase
LRKTYGRRKIVLIGHSWGSLLGARLALKHPDWFYAYVGMGQVVDFPKNEAIGYQATLAAARTAGDRPAIEELESIAPFPDPQHPERNLQNLQKERHWLAKYRGAVWRGDEDSLGDIGRLSPDYTDQDRASRNAGLDFSLQTLWVPLTRASIWQDTHFGCPVILLEGRYDQNTPASLAEQWFARIDAPSKKLVWFENAAHMVYEEEPGKTLVTLVQDVLPLTR